MPYKTDGHGFFTEVNGLPVAKRALPGGFYSGWPSKPHGVMLHGTAGCSNDIFEVLRSRGISVHFCVGRDGSITQYVSLRNRAAHAYHANHTHWAIEHTGQSSSCRWYTQAQLASSGKLSAAIREWSRRNLANPIPLSHIPGANLETYGFKEHYDGCNPTAYWNPNVHVDRPGSFWGWDAYLAEVAKYPDAVPKAYVYAGRVYTSLDNLLRKLKRELPNSDLHEVHEIKVRRKPTSG